MQIGSTELIIILALLALVYGFYVVKPSSSAGSAARRPGHEAQSGRSSDEGAKGETAGSTRDQAGGARSSGAKDPYAVLNIPPNATQDEVTAAYRRMAQMYHPDKVAGLAPEYREIAEKKMKEINVAYEQLRR